MVRMSAARLVRALFGLVIVFMAINFASRYLFSSDGKITALRRSAEQTLVDYMAAHLSIKYEVTNNLEDDFVFIGRITFTNTGSQPISSGPWKIYFFHPVDIEDTRKDEIGAELANRMMFISHVNGGLFKLQPTSLFAPIDPGQSLQIPFHGGRWISSKTDVYPNWYVSVRGAKSTVIANTAGESLSFVADFDREPLWKRNTKDKYNPFTPKERFLRNEIEDLGRAGGYIIPTPLQVKVSKGAYLKVDMDTWVVVGTTKHLQNEVTYFAEKTGMKEVQYTPKSKFIRLQQGEVDLPGADVIKDEAYSLIVDQNTVAITITSPTPAGIFYGIQSLISLMADDGQTVPVVRVVDAPRYHYRGFMLDVGRNFRPKKEVFEMIDLMASYKLNKFHFHLTEDEGWRIEIPDLPELANEIGWKLISIHHSDREFFFSSYKYGKQLTQLNINFNNVVEVGSKKCDDLTETECLLPYNGVGPNGLTDGYYTVSDYKEILMYAKQRHVEVIPEVDVPGHAHAAIKAMEVRYNNLHRAGKAIAAEQYLLSDPEDESKYHSVQQFKDNAINVCMESSYRFMELILTTLVGFHKDIMPIKTFHVGGDEVPRMALMKSPKCLEFMEKYGYYSQANLTTHFTQRLLTIAAKYNLAIQGWEDVFYKHQRLQHFTGPISTTVNVWANVWTGKNVFRAHDLANHNHKVVLGPATHLYLDHPHEPHPDERGLFWATRFVDTYKVFGFMPDSFYSNIDIDGFGHPLSKHKVCGKSKSKCPDLLNPQNVIGIEAHLWGETVRMEEHLHMMTFPRLIAMAERAWHRANWELEPNAHMRTRRKNEDWVKFTNTLGYHELPRLEKRGIKYHIPVPGALVEDGKLKMNSAIPGLPFVASSDGGRTWIRLVNDKRVSGETLLATSSHDATRRSRSIEITVG